MDTHQLWPTRRLKDGTLKWDFKEEKFDFETLRQHWDTFKQVATGKLSKEAIDGLFSENE